MKQSALVQR